MVPTIWRYIRERYSSPLFPLLALFLMLYANGAGWDPVRGTLCFLYTLVLLFWFRLYDDLASREIDAGKPDRTYTDPEAHRRLRRVVVPLGCMLLAATLLADLRGGALLAVWFVMQRIVYRLLFDRGGWRHLLPLLKYPVIALLLALLAGSMNGGDERMLGRLSAYLSLLPLFILFEALDDRSYHLPRPVSALLLLAAHLLLVPEMSSALYPFALAGLALVALLAYLHDRVSIAGAPYLLMLYFLLLRVSTIYVL